MDNKEGILLTPNNISLPIIIQNNNPIKESIISHKIINNTTNIKLKNNGNNIIENDQTEHLNNNNVVNNFINDLKDKIDNKSYSIKKNSSKDSITNSQSIQSNTSLNNFLFLNNKRGRPKKNNENIFSNKKKHSRLSVDNIIRKIQVHYLTFLVKYVNYFLRKYLIKPFPTFSQLSYELKKNINKGFRQSLENKKIGEILKNKESIKNKNSNENISNKDVFDYVYNANIEIKKLLNINYLIFFKEVYASCIFDIATYTTKRYKIPKTIKKITGLFEEDDEIYNGKIYEVCKYKFIKHKDKNNTNNK